MNTDVDVKEVVRARYGEAATRVAQGAGNSCCGCLLYTSPSPRD